MTTRYSAVAGSFYPADAEPLRQQIEQLLSGADKPALAPRALPRALIVPHAGYFYSGPIAATAYNTLIDNSHKIGRVVILGPSHRVPLYGIATPGCDRFQTPLGTIALDTDALAEIGDHEGVRTHPAAHAREHSLEVQLPFLQAVLGSFQLVPLVVGDAAPEQVAAVLNTLWSDKDDGNEMTLTVISSDLSHYHPYRMAVNLDLDTTEKIENLTTDLDGEQACGCHSINGLLYAASQRGLRIKTLDLRNSGDTAGDKDRVVGYGAYALY